MDEENTGIVEKIRKLHALGERAGTEAEAALAAARVQELLAKYNLELGEVILQEDPGAEIEVGREWRRIPSHLPSVAGACDQLFDVRHYLCGSRWGGYQFVFVGLKANVEAATMTYEYLVEAIEGLARGAKSQGLIYGTEEFLAFRIGASCRIREIAWERKSQAMASNPAYGQLVHIGNALAEKMIDALELKGHRGGTGGFMSYGSDAYEHGYAQGSRVDLAGARSSRMLK